MVEKNSNVMDWQQDDDGYVPVYQIETKLIILIFTLSQSISNVPLQYRMPDCDAASLSLAGRGDRNWCCC